MIVANRRARRISASAIRHANRQVPASGACRRIATCLVQQPARVYGIRLTCLLVMVPSLNHPRKGPQRASPDPTSKAAPPSSTEKRTVLGEPRGRGRGVVGQGGAEAAACANPRRPQARRRDDAPVAPRQRDVLRHRAGRHQNLSLVEGRRLICFGASRPAPPEYYSKKGAALPRSRAARLPGREERLVLLAGPPSIGIDADLVAF